MTTSAQTPADLRVYKRVPDWSSPPERPVSAGPYERSQGIRNNPPRAGRRRQARAVDEDLALAAHIHSQLMSIELPSVPYASMDARTIPCRAMGGDFFDAIALPDSLFAVVADVSGKGTPAAIVAAMLQGIIHAQMLADQAPPAIAATVNEFLCSRATGKFATMVLLKVYAGGGMEYVNCGHIPPVLVSGDNVRLLEGGSVVVGLLPEARYRLEHHHLLPDERILIFTDGITEAENSLGDQFGDSAFNDCDRLASVDTVLKHAASFQGKLDREDDWTLLELLYRGEKQKTVVPTR